MKKEVFEYKAPGMKVVDCKVPCSLCVSPPSTDEDISGDGEDIPIIGF